MVLYKGDKRLHFFFITPFDRTGHRIRWSVLFYGKTPPPMSNPRSKNGNLRRKHRARMKAIGAPCGICGGKFGPIHYDEPSDAKHPLSFVIDEIKPVSRWREFGYDSPEAAAQDWNNLQAAHYYCNAMKGAHVPQDPTPVIRHPVIRDGDW